MAKTSEAGSPGGYENPTNGDASSGGAPEARSAATTWEQLAVEEIEAARMGGREWREFVAYAERVTGRPWSWIRLKIDPYVAEEYERREAELGR